MQLNFFDDIYPYFKASRVCSEWNDNWTKRNFLLLHKNPFIITDLNHLSSNIFSSKNGGWPVTSINGSENEFVAFPIGSKLHEIGEADMYRWFMFLLLLIWICWKRKRKNVSKKSITKHNGVQIIGWGWFRTNQKSIFGMIAFFWSATTKKNSSTNHFLIADLEMLLFNNSTLIENNAI